MSIPEGVSTMRGYALPSRGSRVVPFTINPPSRSRSMKSENSSPKPKVPDAVSIGFFSFIAPISTASDGDNILLSVIIF